MADGELLDVYDDVGTHLGVARRDVVHRDGLWHRCFHLWVVCGEEVLLQRRSRGKETHPGLLDATAAGHLGAGEGVLDGGLREVREELGAVLAPADLVAVGVRRVDDRVGPGGRLHNRERQHIFFAADPRPLEAWTGFDREELDGLVALRLGNFAALAAGEDPGPWPARAWDGTAVRTVPLSRAEVIPGAYLPSLAAALQRFARGERSLAI